MLTNDDPVTRRAFLTIGSLGLGAIGVGLARAASAQASVSRETEQMNARLVTEFCESFVKGDVAKATSLLSENCIYRPSQTSPPVTGREMVAESVKRMITERGGIDFKVLKTVTLGPIVVNERDDIPREPRTIKGKVINKFHVAAGVFFVTDGKIVEWTDYVFL
jgi:limonene-1,2-epoxide hydrolase